MTHLYQNAMLILHIGIILIVVMTIFLLARKLLRCKEANKELKTDNEVLTVEVSRKTKEVDALIVSSKELRGKLEEFTSHTYTKIEDFSAEYLGFEIKTQKNVNSLLYEIGLDYLKHYLFESGNGYVLAIRFINNSFEVCFAKPKNLPKDHQISDKITLEALNGLKALGNENLFLYYGSKEIEK